MLMRMTLPEKDMSDELSEIEVQNCWCNILKKEWLILYTNTEQHRSILNSNAKGQRWKLSSLLPDAGVGSRFDGRICELETLIISVFSAESGK